MNLVEGSIGPTTPSLLGSANRRYLARWDLVLESLSLNLVLGILSLEACPWFLSLVDYHPITVLRWRLKVTSSLIFVRKSAA